MRLSLFFNLFFINKSIILFINLNWIYHFRVKRRESLDPIVRGRRVVLKNCTTFQSPEKKPYPHSEKKKNFKPITFNSDRSKTLFRIASLVMISKKNNYWLTIYISLAENHDKHADHKISKLLRVWSDNKILSDKLSHFTP